MSGNPVLSGIKRGLALRCPECGEGKLFRAYLKVDPVCDACGHENGRYKADDGPAYFTIVLIGHVVIAPLLLLEFIWTWDPMTVVAITLPALAVITLATLPVVKGGVVGLMWGLARRGGLSAAADGGRDRD